MQIEPKQIANLDAYLGNYISQNTPSGGGGLHTIWAEETGDLNPNTGNGFQFSFGNGVMNDFGLLISYDCSITALSFSSKLPATGVIEIYVNGAATGKTITLSNQLQLSVPITNLNLVAGSRINFKTISGSGGQNIVVSCTVATEGVVGPQGEMGLIGENAGINVKEYGAIGDGTLRTVNDWLIGEPYDRGYADLAAIQVDYPFVTSLSYNADLAAFQKAVSLTDAGGGTVYFPNGTYVADGGSFAAYKDNVRIVGESVRGTILTTLTGAGTTLAVSGYRHVGWDRTQTGMKPYTNTMKIGQGFITLKDAADAANFIVGDKVFINGGSTIQFDQEFGEFNIIKSIDGAVLYLEYPLLRDYSIETVPFSGTLLADFTVPAVDATVNVNIDFEHNIIPSNNLFISIGNDLYQIISSSGDASNATVEVKNCKASNATGTISAGAKIFKGRAIFRTPESYANNTFENLTSQANADCIGLSNSIGTRINNVRTLRRAGGGLWLDGDDGRDAVFTNCEFLGETPVSSQPARSFAEMHFRNCQFKQCGIHFSEFVNNSSVVGCRFYLHRDIGDTYEDVTPIAIGWTTSNIRVSNNDIYIEGMTSAIDTFPDVNGYTNAYRGGIEIKDNFINANNCGQFIRAEQLGATEISGNKMFGSAEFVLAVSGHTMVDGGDGTRTFGGKYVGVSYLHIHHNQFSGSCNILNYGRPVNMKFTDNYIHQITELTGNNKLSGNIMWSAGAVAQPTEMVIFENNIFKNWRYYNNSFNYQGTLNRNVRILNNEFIDATGGDRTGTFVVHYYPRIVTQSAAAANGAVYTMTSGAKELSLYITGDSIGASGARFVFPSNPFDGDTVTIYFNNKYDTLNDTFQLDANSVGRIIEGGLTSVYGTSHQKFEYVMATNKWIRV